MNVATSGDGPGATAGEALGDSPAHSFFISQAEEETARTSQNLELTLGTAEVITQFESPGVLATLLDTPGLSATFLLAKLPNTSALDSMQDTSDLSATFLLAKERTNSRSDLGTAKASTPTPGVSSNTSALGSLLDASGLPDTLLGSRTPNRPPLGLLNTFSDQVGTELSSENFSHHISSGSESIEVSSQEFLEGLAESKGRKTSSGLLASDDGIQNIPRYSFAELSSSNLSEVSNVFSTPGSTCHKTQSPREEAHNSSLPQDRPRRKPDQESCQVNTVQREEASFMASEEGCSTKYEAPAKHRQKFSPKEDSHLVNFFLAEGCYGERKGVAVWKRIAVQEICPGRTWQSLKERFLKRILPKLEELKVTENALLRASDRSMKPSSSNQYSREEDRNIVRFIRTKRRLTKANGNMLWKVLAAQDPDKKRSWQSLRGRFLKVMMKRREEFGL